MMKKETTTPETPKTEKLKRYTVYVDKEIALTTSSYNAMISKVERLKSEKVQFFKMKDTKLDRTLVYMLRPNSNAYIIS